MATLNMQKLMREEREATAKARRSTGKWSMQLQPAFVRAMISHASTHPHYLTFDREHYAELLGLCYGLGYI